MDYIFLICQNILCLFVRMDLTLLVSHIMFTLIRNGGPLQELRTEATTDD